MGLDRESQHGLLLKERNNSVFLEGVVYLQGGLKREQKPAHGIPAPLSG